jgi:hypothetical protein
MTKRFTLTATTGLLMLVLAGVCLSQDAKTSAAERDFQRFDGNQSGWLSGKELIECQCKSYDRNGDNEVTKAEFFAGRGVTLQPNKPEDRDTLAQETQRKLQPGDIVDVGGGMTAKILRCRGAGDSQECEIQYYRRDALESIPRWENISFLRSAQERLLNYKKQQPAEQPQTENPNRAQQQPVPPIEAKETQANAKTATDCSFNPPPGDASRTAEPSEQLFKRKIYDRHNVYANGTVTAPLKVGVTFLSFQVSAPFKNIVRVDPVRGALRINDAAPVNAMIYPVKSEHIVCEQYRDGVQRKRVENKYACFKNRDGAWVCWADGIPKTTPLN